MDRARPFTPRPLTCGRHKGKRRALDRRPDRGMPRLASALIVAAAVLGGLAANVSAQTATLTCTLSTTQTNRPNVITGAVSITPTGGSSGPYDLYVNFNNAKGRVFDRVETRVNVTAKTVVPFTISTANAQVQPAVSRAGDGQVHGRHGVSSSNVYVNVVPYTIDYDDFWCNVWAAGTRRRRFGMKRFAILRLWIVTCELP